MPLWPDRALLPPVQALAEVKVMAFFQLCKVLSSIGSIGAILSAVFTLPGQVLDFLAGSFQGGFYVRRYGVATLSAVLLFLVAFVPVAPAAEGSGQKAPVFQEELLGGGEFDLTPHIGKKVIMLDFWSIYCVSCVQEMPHLVKIQQKYPNELLTVGIDLDSFGTKRVQQFVDKLDFKIPYPIVVDKRRKVAGLYSVSVLPTTILIDKAGKIAMFHVGYKPGDEDDIEKKIRELAGLK